MDPLTGQSFEHRRTLIEQRIHLLAGCFALSVHAYAVMSNHLHLVIHTDPAAANGWSDDEVIARWRTALPSRKHNSKSPGATDDPAAQPKVSAEWIADKRLRLASLSWFMKLLNENIARRANVEDGCTGHFWVAHGHTAGRDASYSALPRARLIRRPIPVTSLARRTHHHRHHGA